MDVGGGTGPYAFWLSDLGYEVHLVDAMPLHIEIARKKSEEARSPLASVEVGDARSLQWQDATVDAVLLMGPLYHLTARADRLRALAEARRVLRPGGMVFANTSNGLGYDLVLLGQVEPKPIDVDRVQARLRDPAKPRQAGALPLRMQYCRCRSGEPAINENSCGR